MSNRSRARKKIPKALKGTNSPERRQDAAGRSAETIGARSRQNPAGHSGAQHLPPGKLSWILGTLGLVFLLAILVAFSSVWMMLHRH